MSGLLVKLKAVNPQRDLPNWQYFVGLYPGLDMRNQSLEFMHANSAKPEAIIIGYREASTTARCKPRIRKSIGAESTFATDQTEVV